MTEERSIGYWVQLVDRMLADRFAATIEEHGVTHRQWQLLSLLSHGPATTEQLDALGSEGDGATDLAELIESGWVATRSTGHELTDRGNTAFLRLRDVLEANRDIATEGIAAGELATAASALERMARNLGWND